MNVLNLPAAGERRYLQIAKNLAARIEAGEYGAGTRLPPERELAAALGVSRTTVREALLALELMAYVEIRVGSGVFVLDAEARSSARTMAPEPDLTEEAGPFEIVEMRRVVEGAAAARAAERITDEQLDRLGRVQARMRAGIDDVPAFDRADREFHVVLAAASGNSLMERSVRELWALRAGPMWARWYDQTRARGNRVQSVADHERILAALRRRLPDVAGTAMRAHIDVLADRFFELDLEPTENERRAG